MMSELELRRAFSDRSLTSPDNMFRDFLLEYSAGLKENKSHYELTYVSEPNGTVNTTGF